MRSFTPSGLNVKAPLPVYAVRVNPVNVSDIVPQENSMFKKVLFWLSIAVDLFWAGTILWAGSQIENAGFFAWSVIIVLALYPVQVVYKNFQIKWLSGE